MVIYGVVFDFGLTRENLIAINKLCEEKETLEFVISDDNDYAMLGTVLDERSSVIPLKARDYAGDYGPTADQVMDLQRSLPDLGFDDLIADIYVFEPYVT